MQTKELKDSTFFAFVEEKLIRNGRVRLRVKDMSVQLLICNNKDEVLLKRMGDNLLIPERIYLFKYNDQYILHRLKRTEGFWGDNVIIKKEICKKDDVIAVVEEVYRGSQTFDHLTMCWRIQILFHRIKLQLRLFLNKIYHAVKYWMILTLIVRFP